MRCTAEGVALDFVSGDLNHLPGMVQTAKKEFHPISCRATYLNHVPEMLRAAEIGLHPILCRPAELLLQLRIVVIPEARTALRWGFIRFWGYLMITLGRQLQRLAGVAVSSTE